MDISFNGIETKVITFYGPNVNVGDLVIIKQNYTVEKCADGDEFIGIVISKRGEYVGVQTSGYIEISSMASSVPYGYVTMTSTGSNGIQKSDTAVKAHLVVKKDTTRDIVGFIL